jgi:catechol 2,3-dioxygenase-like lactoylglutathione lyase family enzyme
VQPLVRATSKQASEEFEEDTMSRVQLALRVSDLEGSIRFYSSLFGVEPAKRRPGYANFAVVEPPLKLVLLEGEADRPTVMDHLGVEVESTDEVNDATERLSELGLFTQVEDDTTCCYARQDKVWVQGPGHEPWEVYTVKEDSQDFGTNGIISTMPDDATGEAGSESGETSACCGVTACRSHDEPATEPGVTVTEAKTSAGCGCVA